MAALYDGVQGQFYRDKVLACTGNQISWDDANGYWDIKNVSQVNTNSIEYRNNCAGNDLLNDKNWTKIRASLRI